MCTYIYIFLHKELDCKTRKDGEISTFIIQVPRKEDDLKEMDIPEIYKVTSSQERFLILNTAGEESGDLILGFASPAQLEVMRSSPSWYCDGTDSPVSRLNMFSQLFVILADTSEGLSFPVGFSLTSNQCEATYRRIFR